ncbi:signal transduction histidine-protein kinase BaeS [mine drainage metagenome]|uniref:histidine kinase n=1 Tax=mine drainage metagenome TaxID=410659 RepID=A0A1J5R9R8_9ZZZZ
MSGRWITRKLVKAALRSFAFKLAAAALIFAVVPLLIAQQVRLADRQRGDLLLHLIQEQGRLAGEALFPLLDRFSPRTAPALSGAVARLAAGGLSLKLLFRPAAARDGAFLLVASAPERGPAEGPAALARLAASGVLAPLAATCQGQSPLALRLPAGSGAQGQDLLTYLAPHATPRGCWVVLAAQPTGSLPERLIGRPFWRSPEIRAAASIYLLMAVLVLSIFIDAWRNLQRFRKVAQGMGRKPAPSFAEGNRIPELAEVAAGLDAMVGALSRSETLLRQAAEENAHALKGPLAVISQSLEPLRRAVPEADNRARRSLEVIGQSVERLDQLVSVARRIDEAIAGLIDCPRQPVALSALLRRLGQGYARLADERGLRLDLALAPGLVVAGSEEMLETIVENLLDNALDFAPAGSGLTLSLEAERDRLHLRVRDQGPGVAADQLERIFGRHVSRRPDQDGGAHYGLGLWLVRRNAEAMGGGASARRAAGGGLEVTVTLPRFFG